jgi:RNA polymerase sigma factor (TIGR02999 family)
VPDDEMEPSDVTRLLRRWRDGDSGALEDLTPLVYEELRRLARRQMGSERAGHTLQATALVHEAFLRIVDSDVPWRDRVHFFALAARQMRRILVDHARARASQKRGGDGQRISLDAASPAAASASMIELDDLLEQLATIDARKARVVELHLFAGLSYEETAEALDVAPVTVHRDLVFARAWLQRELDGGSRP